MNQSLIKTKKFFELVFFWPGMDDATETIVKKNQACVVNQLLNKYTPLQPNLYLVVLEWKVHWISLVQSMENPFWLISIIIHPIRKVRVFPYYARSNEKLKENFRAAISEGKSWQMESPKNSYASEQIGFILVEDHLVCFCSIANFEQKSIIGILSRTLVKIQFVANAFEGISR